MLRRRPGDGVPRLRQRDGAIRLVVTLDDCGGQANTVRRAARAGGGVAASQVARRRINLAIVYDT